MDFLTLSSARMSLRAARAVPVLRRSLATHASPSFFPDEPTAPSIQSSTIPGPKSLAASAEIAKFQDNRTHVIVANYAASKGASLGSHFLIRAVPPSSAAPSAGAGQATPPLPSPLVAD